MTSAEIRAAMEHCRRPDGIVRMDRVRELLRASPEERAAACDMARAARDEASIARERSMGDEP